MPLPSEEFWPKSSAPEMFPPPITRKPKKGRPIRKMRLEAEEIEAIVHNGKVRRKGTVMHCSVCKSTQHNKTFHNIKAGSKQRTKKLSVELLIN